MWYERTYANTFLYIYIYTYHIHTHWSKRAFQHQCVAQHMWYEHTHTNIILYIDTYIRIIYTHIEVIRDFSINLLQVYTEKNLRVCVHITCVVQHVHAEMRDYFGVYVCNTYICIYIQKCICVCAFISHVLYRSNRTFQH